MQKGKWRVHVLIVVLVTVLGFLQYRLWFEEGGVVDMWRLKKQIASAELQNTALKKRNDELAFQLKRLNDAVDATEARARNELGMIKKNEKFYQILKADKTEQNN